MFFYSLVIVQQHKLVLKRFQELLVLSLYKYDASWSIYMVSHKDH